MIQRYAGYLFLYHELEAVFVNDIIWIKANHALIGVDTQGGFTGNIMRDVPLLGLSSGQSHFLGANDWIARIGLLLGR
jgi:hypothetical protein